MCKSVSLLAALLFGSSVLLASQQAEEMKPGGADVVPLALDRILVTLPTGLTYEQEVTLRIVRQGYQKKRSKRQEDRDVWVCWFGQPIRYLRCARNGDLWVRHSRSHLPNDKKLKNQAGYGSIQVTTFPVDRRWLKKTLTALPGSDDFDVEFISMVMAGASPPLEIPDDEELDRFVSVWNKIGKLEKYGDPEDIRLTIIADAGFSSNRYQHISRLIEIYRSIEIEVDKRMEQLR